MGRHSSTGTAVGSRRASRKVSIQVAPRTKVFVGAAAALAVPTALLAGAGSAGAANSNTHNPIAHTTSITRTATAFTVRGWAIDPDARGQSVIIQVTVDNRVATRMRTNSATAFTATVKVTAVTHTLCVSAGNIGPGVGTSMGCVELNAAGRVVKPAPAPAPDRNAAIAKLAATFVGYRYVDNGASPGQGFDCSGLVQYVYRTAANITVPHNAQAQYNGAHRITAAQARQGDLVFFHDGSGAVYHVGIYAAPNRMWAAATPADGVRFQSIWSSAVTYGSYTH